MFISLQYGAALLFDETFDAQRHAAVLLPRRVHAPRFGHAVPPRVSRRAAGSSPRCRCFRELKNCPGGGSPKPPQIHAEVQRELGGARCGVGLGAHRGADPHDGHRRRTPKTSSRITEGFAMPGVELIVVQGSTARRPRPGEEGELRAKAPQMMLGYLDDALDADAFDENGYFRTGDLGMIDEEGYRDDNRPVEGHHHPQRARTSRRRRSRTCSTRTRSGAGRRGDRPARRQDRRTGRARSSRSKPVRAVHVRWRCSSSCATPGIRTQAVPEQLEIVAVDPPQPERARSRRTRCASRFDGQAVHPFTEEEIDNGESDHLPQRQLRLVRTMRWRSPKRTGRRRRRRALPQDAARPGDAREDRRHARRPGRGPRAQGRQVRKAGPRSRDDFVGKPKAVVDILVKHKELHAAPVLVRKGNKAIIGRPKDRVAPLLERQTGPT